MKAFSDDLYYGNINPNDQEFQRGTVYAKALQIVFVSEEQLNKLLSGKEKEFNSAVGKVGCIFRGGQGKRRI